MIRRIASFVLALIAPMVLTGCILTPGKFVSTLTINADRSFTFTYQGEVIAVDPSKSMRSLGKSAGTDEPASDAHDAKPAEPGKPNAKDAPDPADAPSESDEAKYREIASALAKEEGYKSVVYKGKGKFDIDYAISGMLTHNFIYPWNSDAEAIFPFVAVELRAGGTVRVKAPAFAKGNSDSTMGMGSSSEASKNLDGIFTIDTDAEIISQNNEGGVTEVRKRRQIVWRATPLTKDAPTAVLRLKR